MTNSGSNNKNKAMLQNLKTEAANSVNVNLKQDYNGDLTAREAGSVGGEMVKRMIAYAEQNMNGGNSGNNN
ncbi:MAG: alpha/beta-type small acid-soluble spore protein [Clostridia bacterium]|nr:alpha/beta-type small acid-soluble spore protein [Clostridia bacterium]